ncbi:hypothetical protein T265_03142 [Opisthorchis viverrini]|uniref:Uncharacterized protein n=1 Tax=Opisthorchis viverrini TaxID=6198 RepID=A0A074ZWV8_OPIVI|nr:hypothetical protein T265_03142 [Opisthorchis viverrini]KER30407.1 hypothetical protein T265_03142 [Opisthorchis viverrini]
MIEGHRLFSSQHDEDIRSANVSRNRWTSVPRTMNECGRETDRTQIPHASGHPQTTEQGTPDLSPLTSHERVAHHQQHNMCSTLILRSPVAMIICLMLGKAAPPEIHGTKTSFPCVLLPADPETKFQIVTLLENIEIDVCVVSQRGMDTEVFMFEANRINVFCELEWFGVYNGLCAEHDVLELRNTTKCV